MTTPLSNSLHIADISTTLHPYTDARKHEKQGPIVIDRGEGIHVYDSNGKKYIEALTGLWSVAVGFNEQRLCDARGQPRGAARLGAALLVLLRGHAAHAAA